MACTSTVVWLIPDDPALSGADNAAARGMDQVMVFDTARPPLRSLCPSLPWADVAGADQVHISYMWLSSVAWAMFRLDESADEAVVDDSILTPAAITRAMRRLVDSGVSMAAQEDSQVVVFIHDRVREASHNDYELQVADLGSTEVLGTAATEKPAARLAYTRELTLSGMSTASRSLMPMCMYEYTMGPRIMNAGGADHGRFNPKSHHTKMWSKLTSTQSTLHPSVRPLVDDKAGKEDISDAQLAAAAELFVALRCPRTLVPYSYTKAGKSPIRARALQILMDWHYHPGMHDNLRRAAFDSYALGFDILR